MDETLQARQAWTRPLLDKMNGWLHATSAKLSAEVAVAIHYALSRWEALFVLARNADHPINRISELQPWNVSLLAALAV